jgi:hypothetical protein
MLREKTCRCGYTRFEKLRLGLVHYRPAVKEVYRPHRVNNNVQGHSGHRDGRNCSGAEGPAGFPHITLLVGVRGCESLESLSAWWTQVRKKIDKTSSLVVYLDIFDRELYYYTEDEILL